MVRWAYVIPRLVVVALFGALVYFGFDPALRYVVVKSTESLLGTKVDIGEITTCWRQGRLQVKNAAVAAPWAIRKNVFEFDRATVVVDKQQLFQKRLIVDYAELLNLRIDTDRQDSGFLPGESANDLTGWFERAEGIGRLDRGWAQSLQGHFEEKLEADLETIRVGQVVTTYWLGQHETLQARAELWRLQVLRIKNAFEWLQKNPLQDPRVYEQLAIDVKALAVELQAVRETVMQLARRARSDRKAISEAKDHDVEYLKRNVVQMGLDVRRMSDYFIGEEARQQLAQAQTWYSSASDIFALLARKPEFVQAERRGVDVVFQGQPTQPSFLIREARFQGTATVGGGRKPLIGRLQDLTSAPQIGKPFACEFRLGGEAPIQARVLVDQASHSPSGELFLDCPKLNLASRTWGDPATFSLDVSAGEGRVWMRVKLSEERIDGRIVIKQDEITMKPTLPLEGRGARFVTYFCKSVEQIDHLHMAIELQGELSNPKVSIETNLSQDLARSLQGAATNELRECLRKWVRTTEVVAADHLGKLQSGFQRLESQVLQSLEVGEKQLAEVRGYVSAGVGLPASPASASSMIQGMLKR